MSGLGGSTLGKDGLEAAQALTVLQRHGKSFHFAGQLLSRRHMQDAAELYAFCRYVDDLTDHAEDAAKARARLDQVEDDLLKGHSANVHVHRFLALAGRCGCDLEAARQLVTGQRGDLGTVLVCDDAELKRYCYRVAGTVGLLMCSVLGVRDNRALPFAIDLGIGMQLTNIARDIAEDARAGRRYIPANLLPLEPNEIAAGSLEVRPALYQAASAILADAERYYRSGEAGLTYLPLRARLAIFVAARVYHGIGEELMRRPPTMWKERAVVSPLRKVVLATSTMVEFIQRGALCREPVEHDASLHRHLAGLPGSDPRVSKRP